MLKKIIFSTNAQKILCFLIRNSGHEYFDRQISKLAGVSKAGTNFALRDLAKEGLIAREKRGRMIFYKVLDDDPAIRYLKILQNIVSLYSLIKNLKRHALRIVLYGSSAEGQNHADSDIDVFVMSREPGKIKETIFKDKLMGKIQYVVHSPEEYVKSKKNNPVFYAEVEKGIVLWERKSV